MKDRYRKFYECVGKNYPEDKIVYSTISGVLRKKWILAKLKTMPAGNLLDCGCNVGRLSSDWKKGTVFGVDISFSVLQRGIKIFPKTNFIQGDLREIAFLKSRSIDNAIACEVLEHLDKPLDFLKGLYRVMKKQGTVLITVPSYTYSPPRCVSLGIMRSFGVCEGTEGTLLLHTAYKPDELAKLASQTGFQITEKGSFEIELRGWLKPLTTIENAFGLLSENFFPNSRINYLFERCINCLKINLFYILDTFAFSKLLKRIFKEGRRSYILARK